ncbi:MAG: hypothetical protein AAF404_07295 [Pseudomonadota bacterium]
MSRISMTLASVCALALLSGCQSTSDQPVNLDAESYEYKGAADPLLSVPSSERAGELGNRFDLIQARQ